MMVPSGYGSLPSREALIATSLPRIARRSLRLPSSWATEINRQSRYPRGILTPEIGAASPSGCPDTGAMVTATPASAANATSTKTIRVIVFSPIAFSPWITAAMGYCRPPVSHPQLHAHRDVVRRLRPVARILQHDLPLQLAHQ